MVRTIVKLQYLRVCCDQQTAYARGPRGRHRGRKFKSLTAVWGLIPGLTELWKCGGRRHGLGACGPKEDVGVGGVDVLVVVVGRVAD